MPWVIAGAAIIGAGAAIFSGAQAANQASANNAYQEKVAEQNATYRLEVMRYQNDQYANDITHYGAMIGFQKEEFARAKDIAAMQSKSINTNYTSQVGQVLLRKVQEDVAAALQTDTANSQVGSTKGTLRARGADSGVAGNSVAEVEGEVDRQGGDARRAIERNREGTENTLRLQMLGVKAQRDTALGSITLPAFAPIAPPSTPAPVSPVNPAPPSSGPGAASVVIGGINSGIQLGAGTAALINAIKNW